MTVIDTSQIYFASPPVTLFQRTWLMWESRYCLLFIRIIELIFTFCGFIRVSFNKSGFRLEKMVRSRKDISAITPSFIKASSYFCSCLFRSTFIKEVELVKSSDHTNYVADSLFCLSKVGIAAHIWW